MSVAADPVLLLASAKSRLDYAADLARGRYTAPGYRARARYRAMQLAQEALRIMYAAVAPDAGHVTHGRHCTCTPCKVENWPRITSPCGMHGPACPALYAPLGVAGTPRTAKVNP